MGSQSSIKRMCPKKSKKKIIIGLSAFLVLGFTGCNSTPTKNQSEQDSQIIAMEAMARMEKLLEQADRGDIFTENAPAKIATIGILKPEGIFLSSDEQWIPEMIKSVMNNNFRKFASGRITVMNITDEEALNNEITKSLLGPNDELSLTARMAARSIMTGRVIKIQGTTQFTLEFTVTETETHAILAAYSKNHSDIEIIEGIALNKATESLLKDLNVKLNEAGTYALYGASNEADTALAKGLSAAETGHGLQAMNYLFNAVSYNTTALQASAPLEVVQRQNERELQGAGSIVMDFFERQELWQNRLDEFNSFYSHHAPFELFYTPPTPTNMRGSGENRTYDLQFKIGLRWNQNQIEVMEKVLQEYILDGLIKNPPQDVQRWELRGLPDNSNLFMGPDNFIFNLDINVENERGDILSSSPIRLNASLYRYQGKIYADCIQEYEASFRNINYIRDQITPQLYIRIVSINNINIRTAGESGFIRVAQTQDRELPIIQPNNLPRGLLNSMEREMAITRRRERVAATETERQRQAAQREAERQRVIREKEIEKAAKERRLNNIRNSTRVGLGAYGGPILGTKAGTITANFDLGYKAFDMEWGCVFYPGSSAYELKNVSSDIDKIINLGINTGMNFVFISLRSFFYFGPGLTFILPHSNNEDATKKTEIFFLPNFQAKLDFQLYSFFYLRLGYRFDLYHENLVPIFKDNSFKTIGRFSAAHNLLFGLQFISY